MEVHCGQCLGCRVDRAGTWAVRILHESSMHEFAYGNSFVTLTYRSKEECTPEQLKKGYHVPSDFSLHQSHVQKFLKRLRRAYPDRSIRYYYCGEYGNYCAHNYHIDVCPVGCQTGRPHYHLCLFNFRPGDGSPIGPDLYASDELDKIWKYGFTSYGDLTFQSAAYVSSYVLKKITGAQAMDKYYQFREDDGCDIWISPEFSRMSLRPAIGKEWLEEYKDDCFSDDGIPVPGVGMKHLTPRYYLKWLEQNFPEVHEEVTKKRREFMKTNADEFTSDRLMAKYKVTKANRALFNKRNEL